MKPRFTIQPAIRLLFIRAALSLSLYIYIYTIYEALPRFFRSYTAYILAPFSEMAGAQLRFPGNFGGRVLLAVSYSIDDPRDDTIPRIVR